MDIFDFIVLIVIAIGISNISSSINDLKKSIDRRGNGH